MNLRNDIFVPIVVTFLSAWAMGSPQTGSTANADSDATTRPQAAQTLLDNGATARTGSADQPPIHRLRPDRQHYMGESGQDHPQEMRYVHLFSRVLGWNEASKELAAQGDPVMSEGFRTHLQRKSGLTAEGAAIVLKIALQWRNDTQAWVEKSKEVQSAVRAANPGVEMTSTNSPELRAVAHERWQIATNAVTQLVTELGSKSFARLDFFIDHMDDHAKEVKARSDAYKAAHPENSQ